MSTKKKQPPEVPAAGAFYNLFASKSTGSPPAGEPHSNVSLRQKAEAHFRERESQSSEKIEALSPESMRTILHELRVHQIELEMQNEELRQTQADLVTSQARYFDLYALAPVGYITVSEEGMVLEANLTAANLLGVVRGALVNQPVTRFFLKEDQDIYHKFCRQLFETGEPQQCELRMVKQDGTTFWAHLSATAAQAPDGEPACRVVLSDVSGRMAAEKSLAMLALRNKTLLQSASDGIHVLDDQGNVVEANASFCRMLGYTHDEAMRLNVADWDAQWSREELLVKIREFIARPCVFETRHRRKDGTLLDVEISGVGVTLDGQDYLYASARDITGRKQAEDQLAVLNQQNKLILNSAAEGILGLDLQGKHTFINPAAAKMLGCEAEELLGHYSHSVWHHTKPDGSPYPKEECPIYAAYLDGTTHSSSTEVFWRKDGTNFPVEYASTPIFEKGRLTGAVVTFADITGRKEMEAKLLEALARAEAADRAKSEFLGVMSHELRTPLNGVLGFSELLSDTPLNDEQKDFVRTISSCGDHLLAIVNDILDFSSIVAGALAIHVAPLAVAEVVKKSENTVRKIAADKGIEFRCEVAAGVPEQIAGDELRICQILINLLGNAVKFTASGSVVL
ncbi:MAG: PAS domain S-box protein, partial [Verrucomicrobiae bacterium]